MKQVTIDVQGMSCGHCVNAVETSVGALNGVSTVKVNLAEATVAIEFQEDIITLNTIKETIEQEGYDVQ